MKNNSFTYWAYTAEDSSEKERFDNSSDDENKTYRSLNRRYYTLKEAREALKDCRDGYVVRQQRSIRRNEQTEVVKIKMRVFPIRRNK
jgi:hypothetical protein